MEGVRLKRAAQDLASLFRLAKRLQCHAMDIGQLRIARAEPRGQSEALQRLGIATLPHQREAERAVQQAVQQCEGNLSEAARRLGISRNTLYRKLRGQAADPTRH